MSEPTWELLGGGGAIGGPVDFVGNWAAGTQYQPGQVVRYNGTDYLAVNPSLGQTPPAVALIPKATGINFQGPWPGAAPGPTSGNAFTIAVAGDYMLSINISAYASAVAQYVCNIWIDGVQTGAVISFFFNTASHHFTLPTAVVFRNLSAGTHYLYLQITGGMTSDSGDKGSLLVVPA